MVQKAKGLLLKRVLDTLIIIMTLPITFPLLVIVAILVRIFIGRPVLFTQTRPGLMAKPFTLIKFRTMSNETDTAGVLRPDADRLGKFGIFLRKTSLDELPEIWNILKGEMSIVGPRPLLMRYLPLYSEEHMARHSVRPGLTGLAQVNGRNTVDWDEKFKMDCQYAANFSLIMDFKIMVKTFLVVLKSDGISSENHATAPEFTGSSKD